MKKVVLQASFSAVPSEKKYVEIPAWLSNFKSIESLVLENFFLDNLINFSELPIQEFVFRDIKISDIDKVIGEIKLFKQLKEISHDQSFPIVARKAFEKSNLSLSLAD